MTDFRRDAGSDFPLPHADLCPDREANLHAAAGQPYPELYNILEGLGPRVP